MTTKWTLAATRLPEQDPDTVRGLALSAGWWSNLLKNPPKQAPATKDDRRCPVLPKCFPIVQPHGLVIARDKTKFHGIEMRESSPKTCPFR